MTDAEESAAATGGPSVLLLGLGNDLLSDDAVGLRLARELQARFAGDNRMHFEETVEMGLALLDFVVGYTVLVVVDALQTGLAAPGTIHEFEAGELRTLPAVAPHFLGLGETLALGKELGMAVPSRVRIIGIEVEDPFTLGTSMTPALATAFPDILERVSEKITELLESA